MASKPKNIDEYLAKVRTDKRAALQKLRKAIKAIVPKAEECTSYNLPAFRLDGRILVCFGASANHCSFFPSSSTTVAALKEELKGYDTSKGTIRFPADKPLPVALVRKIVEARIVENDNRKDRRAEPQAAVDDFMRALKHPLKKEIEAVRRIILSVSPDIQKGIKWNAPSFRTTDYFATLGWIVANTAVFLPEFLLGGLAALAVEHSLRPKQEFVVWKLLHPRDADEQALRRQHQMPARFIGGLPAHS